MAAPQRSSRSTQRLGASRNLRGTKDAGRIALDRQATIASRSTARLVAREIAANFDAVKMISRSPTLDHGIDRPRFTTLGLRLMADHPDWSALSIADTKGNRLLDLPQPMGGATMIADLHELLQRSVGPTITCAIHGAPGQGISAILVLPATDQRLAEPDAVRARPTHTAAIPLVDDDPAVREAAADVLRAHGHDVAEAESLSQGLAALFD